MHRIPLIIEPDPDDSDCALISVDGTVGGRPYRFVLDTGAARSQLEADEYTCRLEAKAGESSSGALGQSPLLSSLSRTWPSARSVPGRSTSRA